MGTIYDELKGVKDLPIGSVWQEPGSSVHRQTGDWKVLQPKFNDKKCINCMFCWAYCPDSSILVKDGKQVGFDLDHCKGCGICAEVCPPKCIDMISARPEAK
ncbi:MAG: 4Fe-4S binding protein [Candidatus Margulisbacteria bacterium]|nr:4Fe-4S binding protein [Candidatus Margulisiibacteriota bacterium]